MLKTGVGKSDVGRVRSNNEDSIFVSNEKIGCLPNLYIVADGMGGHNAGEVASSKSIEFFKNYILQCDESLPIEEVLFSGVAYANKEVYRLSLEDISMIGMGTTFTVCATDGEMLYFAHIGDSRLYVASGDSVIEQITEDHTFVNEMYKSGEFTKAQAQSHPKKNMLTRALGTEEGTAVDSGSRALASGQTIMLCSDGLANMISEEEIMKILNTQSENTEKIDIFIDKANSYGGYDNISVIVI